jgi:glycosyltransferase involved in cell wall biosynthesis
MVNALAARGYDVTVLTADSDTHDLVTGSDWGLADRVDPSVHVVRVPMPVGPGDQVLSHWVPSRLESPAAWLGEANRDWGGAFPEPHRTSWFPQWYPNAGSAARALHAKDPFDLVIATASPWVDFSVPIRLNLETGVPFVIDDRDSWLVNVFTGEDYPEADEIAPLLGLALTNATQSWFVNEPIAQIHRAKFPGEADKIRVVRNGWDPEFSPIPSTYASWDGPGLTFSFVGLVTGGFPLRQVIDAWRLARHADPILRHSTFQMVGPFGTAGVPSAAQQKLLDGARSDGVVAAGTRPKYELAEVYGQTNALLFVKEGGALVTSGKIYEYMATGLPIVSMIQEDHEARTLLEGYPLWFDAGEMKPQALADALVRAAHHPPTGEQHRAARTHGERYRRDLIVDKAFSGLEEDLGWR